MTDPYDDWYQELDRCRRAVDESTDPAATADYAIEAAERLLALARNLKGVACPRCFGFGERAYGSTATWIGGVGGQSLTASVCDSCWGTGRADKTGPNLRRLMSEARR